MTRHYAGGMDYSYIGFARYKAHGVAALFELYAEETPVSGDDIARLTRG